MKLTILSIVVAGVFIGGAIILSMGPTDALNSDTTLNVPINNVSIEGGKQIVNIVAKGGYSPKVSIVQADIPTIIRVETSGTFDCSMALAIPAIQYRAYLPRSGKTNIELPPQKAGTIIQGLCAMGMYNFQVKFQ